MIRPNHQGTMTGTGVRLIVMVDSGDDVMYYCAMPNFTRQLGIAGCIVNSI